MQQESRKQKKNSSPGTLEKKKKTYDKDLVNESLYEVLSYYAPGEARTVGVRTTYTCPECRKAKLDASGAHMRAGCWNANCSVPQFADALGLIAHFESLEPSRQFREVLKKGYEIIGLDPIQPDKQARGSSNSPGSSGKPSSVPQASAATPAWRTVPPVGADCEPSEKVPSSGGPAPDDRPPEALERLRAAVYLSVMDYCKLEERDRAFLRGRGLADESIERGGFGSISFARAQALKATLLDEFGAENLLQVPGFSAKGTGELKFTLTGDYALIPYHGPSGKITTIEGRWTGGGPPPRDMGKYVSLSGAGNHLYVFPGCSAGGIEAFCEGPVGAMVAAQCGITVGAIQGFRRYRSSSGSACDGGYGEPLVELREVGFSGRTIPYIPDVDDPPQPEVSQAAPEAARWLVEMQGGRAALLSLPEGKDLDEWLLKHEPTERRRRFEELLARAAPVAQDPSEKTVNTAANTAGDSPLDETSGEPADHSQQQNGEPDGEDSLRRAVEATQSSADGRPRPASAARNAAEVVDSSTEQEEREELSRTGEDLDEDELRDRVYRAFLEASPLSDRHQRLLMQWKVSKETIVRAGFSSFSPDRVEQLRGDLLKTFERSTLERVPGFAEDSSGKLTLPFEDLEEGLIVFPYKDTGGRVTTLEGVRLAQGLAGEERYVCPGREARLYLPPETQAEEIELLCGGVLGALNLAEAGIRAAAFRDLESLALSNANRGMNLREAPSLHLGDRPVGVFEGQDDSAGLREAVENLGGYPVAVKLPEQVEKLERWIISLPSNKERSQILGRLVGSVRSAPMRPAETSSPDAKQTGGEGQAGGSPTTAETSELQQGSLFDGDSAQDEKKRSQSENGEDGNNKSTSGAQSGWGASGNPQEGVSNAQEEAGDQEEIHRVESLSALHGEGWLEVRFEDIPKIVARDGPCGGEKDERAGGGLEEAGHFAQTPRQAPPRSRLMKHDLQLGAAVGMMCAAAGALACVLLLYALNWPLGLPGSSLSALCSGAAAGGCCPAWGRPWDLARDALEAVRTASRTAPLQTPGPARGRRPPSPSWRPTSS